MKKGLSSLTQKAAKLSLPMRQLQFLLDVGNYWQARKFSSKLLASDHSVDEEALARRALYITTPDPRAMLAGGIALAATLLTAFLAAY